MLPFILENASKPEFWETVAASYAVNSLLSVVVQKIKPNAKLMGWVRLAHGVLNKIDPEGNQSK